MQQKFENFCKIWVVDAGYLWFNSFYFVTVNSTIKLINQLCYFVTQSIDWYDDWKSIDWYDGLDESIFFFLVFFLYKRLHLISLLFVNYSVVKLRYFWWNYFLKNFCLLIGLLRLVYLLMVGPNVLQQQFLYWFTWTSNQLLNLNIFPFLSIQTFLLINLIFLFWWLNLVPAFTG